MLKIVIFDSGIGGELLADKVESELPVVDVIRVIDWQHEKELVKSRRAARRAAEVALRPYLGKVDLIVFANHLLSLTSVSYFRRHYPSQKFVGLRFHYPKKLPKPPHALVLTTTAVSHTFGFQHFIHELSCPLTIISLDDWPKLIDDGELDLAAIRQALSACAPNTKFTPSQIFLTCSHFSTLKPALRRIYGRSVVICDSSQDCYAQICHALSIRGGLIKRK